jgi:hypothetical protein
MWQTTGNFIGFFLHTDPVFPFLIAAGLPVAVPAAVMRARGEVLVMPMFMAAGAKAMECLLHVANRWFSVVYRIGPGLPDIVDTEIPGLVAGVTAANRLTLSAQRVVAGDATHTFEVAVTLVSEGYRTELGGQGDLGLFGRDCVSRDHKCRYKPKE